MIGLVSDLHEQAPDDVLQILRETRPDVIAVTGDTLERYRRGDHLAKGDGSCSSRLVYAGIHMAVHKSARVCHLHGENLPQHRRLSATSPAPLPPKSSAGNPTDRARRY